MSALYLQDNEANLSVAKHDVVVVPRFQILQLKYVDAFRGRSIVALVSSFL